MTISLTIVIMLFQYICEEHFQKISKKSLFTGLQAKTHFGRPQFDRFLRAVANKHSKVRP